MAAILAAAVSLLAFNGALTAELYHSPPNSLLPSASHTSKGVRADCKNKLARVCFYVHTPVSVACSNGNEYYGVPGSDSCCGNGDSINAETDFRSERVLENPYGRETFLRRRHGYSEGPEGDNVEAFEDDFFRPNVQRTILFGASLANGEFDRRFPHSPANPFAEFLPRSGPRLLEPTVIPPFYRPNPSQLIKTDQFSLSPQFGWNQFPSEFLGKNIHLPSNPSFNPTRIPGSDLTASNIFVKPFPERPIGPSVSEANAIPSVFSPSIQGPPEGYKPHQQYFRGPQFFSFGMNNQPPLNFLEGSPDLRNNPDTLGFLDLPPNRLGSLDLPNSPNRLGSLDLPNSPNRLGFLDLPPNRLGSPDLPNSPNRLGSLDLPNSPNRLGFLDCSPNCCSSSNLWGTQNWVSPLELQSPPFFPRPTPIGTIPDNIPGGPRGIIGSNFGESLNIGAGIVSSNSDGSRADINNFVGNRNSGDGDLTVHLYHN